MRLFPSQPTLTLRPLSPLRPLQNPGDYHAPKTIRWVSPGRNSFQRNLPGRFRYNCPATLLVAFYLRYKSICSAKTCD
eukprot:scaffold11273_cov75-Cylindrotheca_fusiformis.AAC.1